MIKSFLIITLRILWRNKVTSFVNIFSLSIGITSFIFIMLYVHHETSYDKFNVNYDHIYRLEGDDYAKLPPSIGAFLQDKIPEIKAVAQLTRMFPAEYSAWRMTYSDETNPEEVRYASVNAVWADTSVFKVFTFNFIQGDPVTCLRHPFKVVITERIAKILFGDGDSIGKTVTMDDRQYEVTGIIQDVGNSHFEVGAFLSMPSVQLTYPDRNLNLTGPNSWLWSATYLLAEGKIDVAVEQKINDVLAPINDGRLFDTVFKKFHLRPLGDLYFAKALQHGDYGMHGNFRLIGILIIIGGLVLILACINYVNLTTARSVVRAKEMAVKRVNGSSIGLIRLQLILESTIVSAIAFIVALTVTQIFINGFNEMIQTRIRIAEWNRLEVWIACFVGIILIGSLAGIYPAFYLTSVKPVKLIKRQTAEHSSSMSFRSVLMVSQFTLSIIMILCAITCLRQTNYFQNANLGFSNEEIVQIETPGNFEQEYTLRETFREELLKSSREILGVSFSAGSPGAFIPSWSVDIEGQEQTLDFFLVDYEYVDVMGIELADGKTFPEMELTQFDTSSQARINVIVNESFVRAFGISNPIGRTYYSKTPAGPRLSEIIGVAKDFHVRSLHHQIGPLWLIQTPPMSKANLRIRSSDIRKTIRSIEQAWKKVYGDGPFDYAFLNETLDRQYKDEEQTATVVTWFTGVALVIACLGLFALSSLVTSQRTKEIGIRKSLGASIESIYGMLTWDFLKWIVLAIVFACPIAWYALYIWLSKFAYHIRLGIDIFIIGSIVAIAVALLTITWQSWRSARGNPVDALKYE